METTPTCPRCGSEHVIPIVYGMPGPSLTEESMAGRVALGAASSSPTPPTSPAVTAATGGAPAP